MGVEILRSATRAATFGVVGIAVLVMPAVTIASELVFDNLRTPPFTSVFADGDPGDLLAQPFLIGDNTAITQVSMLLERGGRPDGALYVEIWDDSGQSTPGTRIARIAEIDDLVSIPTTAEQFDFDTRVMGLTPQEPYYVVLSFVDADVRSQRNSVGWHMVGPEKGTFGASKAAWRGALFLGDARGPEWRFVADDAENTPFEGDANYFRMRVTAVPDLAPLLHAGDADQDLDFDQLDLVKVQIAAKYLAVAPATWGEGDWDGAPGGEVGSPPVGDGLFNQMDIIAALSPEHYLTGPYAALQPNGQPSDGQTSVIYNVGTGELAVDAPAGVELTSINIDSAAGIFTGREAANLGGSFDNDADNNIFKATFGGSFGSISFGNVAQASLSEDFVLNDLTVIGSLSGGGDLGEVDLIYVPEPASILLLGSGFLVAAFLFRHATS